MTTALILAPRPAAADDGFETSDAALFAVAALGVWLARRSLRARAAKRRAAPPD